MFLLVLVVLPILSLGSEVKCGLVNPSIRDFSNCTEASKVVVVGYNGKNLSMFNSLIIVAKPLEKAGLHYVYILIENNPYLEYDKANFFPNLSRIRSYSQNHKQHVIKIFIRNNSRLCIPQEARDKFHKITEGNMFIQKCSCFTNGTLIKNSTVIYGGPKCYQISGQIRFGQGLSDDNKMLRKLNTVEVIHGNLLVHRSNLTTLAFFQRLRKVISREGIPIKITENTRLNFLHMYSLTKVEAKEGEILMYVYDNDFLHCPASELHHYFGIQRRLNKVWNIDGDNVPIDFTFRKCQVVENWYENVEDFADCELLVGNVVIDSKWNDMGRKKLITLFGEVLQIEGCLTIKETNLKILDFMPVLVQVVCKEDRAPVIIEDNPFLEEIQINYNDPVGQNPVFTIRRNPRICNSTIIELQKLNVSSTIVFDGYERECFNPEKEAQKLEWIFYLVALGVFLTINGMAEMIVRLRRRTKRKETVKL